MPEVWMVGPQYRRLAILGWRDSPVTGGCKEAPGPGGGWETEVGKRLVGKIRKTHPAICFPF